LKISDTPKHATGRVTKFISDEQALGATKTVERQLGAQISPAYLSLRRVRVESNGEDDDWATMAAIPTGLDVKIGDSVELNKRYRDPTMPCHFIPWTINRRISDPG
jgi:hypothetical protein